MRNYSIFNNTTEKCHHLSNYNITGNPQERKCLECDISALADNRVPVLNKYSKIDQLWRLTEVDFTLEPLIRAENSLGFKILRTLVDFSTCSTIIEEYSYRIKQLIVLLLNKSYMSHQAVYLFSHLLLKVNSISTVHQRTPILFLISYIVKKYNCFELVQNYNQIVPLFDKFINLLIQTQDDDSRISIIRVVTSIISNWPKELHPPRSINSLSSCITDVLRHGDNEIKSECLLLSCVLLQEEGVVSNYRADISREDNIKLYCESLKALMFTNDTNQQKIAMQFLCDLLSSSHTNNTAHLCLKHDLVEHVFELISNCNEEFTLKAGIEVISLFSTADEFFAQCHHIFAIDPLLKILSSSIKDNIYSIALQVFSILTTILSTVASSRSALSKNDQFAKLLSSIECTIDHHQHDISTSAVMLLTQVLSPYSVTMWFEEYEAKISSILCKAFEKLNSLEISTPILDTDNYDPNNRQLNPSFALFFSTLMEATLSAIRSIFLYEAKNPSSTTQTTEKKSAHLKPVLLVFCEQVLIPTFFALLNHLSPNNVKCFCSIIVELVNYTNEAKELATKLVDMSLIQSLWNYQNNRQDVGQIINEAISSTCMVLIDDKDEKSYADTELKGFLNLRSICDFNDLPSYLIRKYPHQYSSKQAGYIILVYILGQTGDFLSHELWTLLAMVVKQLHIQSNSSNNNTNRSSSCNSLIVKSVMFLVSCYLNKNENSGNYWLQNYSDILIALKQLGKYLSPELIYTQNINLIKFVYQYDNFSHFQRPFMQFWFKNLISLSESRLNKTVQEMMSFMTTTPKIQDDVINYCYKFNIGIIKGYVLFIQTLFSQQTDSSVSQSLLPASMQTLELLLTAPRSEPLKEDLTSLILKVLLTCHHAHLDDTTPNAKLVYQLMQYTLQENQTTTQIALQSVNLINAKLKNHHTKTSYSLINLVVNHVEFMNNLFQKISQKSQFIMEHALLYSTIITITFETNVKMTSKLELSYLIKNLQLNNKSIRIGSLNVLSRIFQTRQLNLLRDVDCSTLQLSPSEKLISSLKELIFLLYNGMLAEDTSIQENTAMCLSAVMEYAYSLNWAAKLLRQLFTMRWSEYLLQILFQGSIPDISLISTIYFCKTLITTVYSESQSVKKTIFDHIYNLFKTVKLDGLINYNFYDFFRETLPFLQGDVERELVETISDTFEMLKKKSLIETGTHQVCNDINEDQIMPISTKFNNQSNIVDMDTDVFIGMQ